MRFVEGLAGEAVYDISFSDENGLDDCAKREELEGCGARFRHCAGRVSG